MESIRQSFGLSPISYTGSVRGHAYRYTLTHRGTGARVEMLDGSGDVLTVGCGFAPHAPTVSDAVSAHLTRAENLTRYAGMPDPWQADYDSHTYHGE